MLQDIGSPSRQPSLVCQWCVVCFWQMLQLLRRGEPAVSADLIRAGVLRVSGLDLEDVSLALPTLASLLRTPHIEYQLVALEAASQMLHNFGPLITANRAVPQDAFGVDLSAEARQQRCQACFELFCELRKMLNHLIAGHGPTRDSAVSLRAKMQGVLGID